VVSEAITNEFRVQVKSRFLDKRRASDDGKFVYEYRIRITNEGNQPARLLSRHWFITDGFGAVEEVRGAGVIGEQPRIVPGETYEYRSYCPLPTQYGVMQGSYTMLGDDGSTFIVEVAPFRLFIPALNN
jgi:ApaG protein